MPEEDNGLPQVNVMEIVKMFVILTLLSTTTGLALGYVNKITEEPIRQAIFDNKIKPALEYVLPKYENDLIVDQFTIGTQDGEVTVFPAIVGGELVAVGFESSEKGYGDVIRIMVGIDLKEKTLRGIGIVAHKESPGLGARIVEAKFTEQFAKNFPVDSIVALKGNGGEIDAISGATISSHSVCGAINKAFEFFKANEEQLTNPPAE